MAIIVDPLNRKRSMWFQPHVGKEIFKAFEPLLANAYSSRSIILVGIILWICAAFFQMHPTSIFGASLFCWSVTVFVVCGVFPETFSGSAIRLRQPDEFIASATYRVTTAKIAKKYDFFIPTIAAAKPHALSVTIWSFFSQGDQFSVSLSSKIQWEAATHGCS